jgi:two-component system chemotaxis response regulator CheB
MVKMSVGRKIRVLIVDDSILFREVLAGGLTADPQIQVVAKAGNPFEARDKILAAKPDVVICDVQMPKMNGIKFIQRLLPQYPISVIVVSTFSEAVFRILRQLPLTIPGILVVQHIPPVFSRMFAERLDKQTVLSAKEAQSADLIEPGKVLIAPGDHHMRLKRVGDCDKVEVFRGEKMNGHCPSVDILFESVAKEAGNRAIGIILTGMGYDGAKGLLSMRRKGARTIGQDEASSVVYGMPRVAFELGAVERQVSLEQIPQVLTAMLR